MNEYGQGKITMPYKNYGRVFVEKEEDIEKVKQIIKEINEEEYEYYLPKDLIAVFTGKKEVTYTHKFNEIDLNDLMIECWKQGVHCFYVV